MTNSIITLNEKKYEARPYSCFLIADNNESFLDSSKPLLYGKLRAELAMVGNQHFIVKHVDADTNHTVLTLRLDTEVNDGYREINNNILFNYTSNVATVKVYFDGLKLTEIKE